MGVALAGRRRLIWLAVAVVVLALLAAGVVRALTAGATQENTGAAEVATVDRGPVTTEVATTGTVQPSQTRSLSFAVKGTVETVKVRAGTTVTPGQVLAAVDDSDAAERVEDAETALVEAEEALDEAESASDEDTTSCAGVNVAAAYTESASPSASASSRPLPPPRLPRRRRRRRPGPPAGPPRRRPPGRPGRRRARRARRPAGGAAAAATPSSPRSSGSTRRG